MKADLALINVQTVTSTALCDEVVIAIGEKNTASILLLIM
ncbi:hypothetical protein [Citrobacter freundii]|uniref:Uncharacterized protein n=1 Tax=Citrobacter freundii TaxID=546 RepID=A0A7G2IKT2_CITFR|nr:hypothetical protein [Citrobacter freundii]